MNGSMNYGIDTLTPGTRVELHPATDAWMRGDRYGVITSRLTGKRATWYRVHMDRSGIDRHVHFTNVSPID